MSKISEVIATLFHSPANVQAEFLQLPALEEFDDLLAAITSHLAD